MALTINGTTGIETNTDTGKIKVGAGDDLELHSDGENGYATATQGNLWLRSDTHVFLSNEASNEYFLKAVNNGAVELYYNGNKQFSTDPQGVVIQGIEGEHGVIYLNADEGDDNADKWGILASRDSSKFSIDNYAGGGWETSLTCEGNGPVKLFYNDALKFQNLSTGAEVTGTIQAYKNKGDSAWPETSYHVFQIDADGTATHIIENSSNNTPYGGIIHFSDAAPDNHTQYFLRCFDSSAARCEIYSDGDVWTSDDSYLSSDETLKENIVDATPKLEDLKKLKVRNFNWKSSYHPEKSKQKQIGFIAQEVEQVFPALIDEHDIAPGMPDDGHTPVMKKAIKTAWNPIIIKAMQELIAKVETLETKVAALEAA